MTATWSLLRGAGHDPAPLVFPVSLAELMARPRGPQTPRDHLAQSMIVDLIEHGYLIGVEVFGTDSCCTHGDQIGLDEVGCASTGYGLCDMFGPHSVGSDCNRANPVLMRPADSLDFDAIHTALTKETR